MEQGLWIRAMGVLAAGLGVSAGAQPSTGSSDTPPRLAGELDKSTIDCYRMHSHAGPLTGSVEITVAVNADGRATAVSTPPGTAERVAAAAQCVGVRTPYRPAIRHGVPVADKLTFEMAFPGLPTHKQPVRHAVEYCHSPWQLSMAYEGRMDLTVRVGRDGKVEEALLPEGMLPWMAEAAKCVAEQLTFYPGALRGTTVESWTVVPVDLNLSRNPHYRGEIAPPKPRSEEAEIIAACRQCYPAGQDDETMIEYRITITNGGRVRKAELIRTSGDGALDEAGGGCIPRRLVLMPAKRNGRRVESTLVWPILVRPPPPAN